MENTLSSPSSSLPFSFSVVVVNHLRAVCLIFDLTHRYGVDALFHLQVT